LIKESKKQKSPGSEFSARGFRRPAASRKPTTGCTAGFTLIELLIVIAIMAIILAVVVFNHQKFNSRIEITNLAYEIALSIREAQVFGLAVHGIHQAFDDGYGVHFDINDEEGRNSFILFTDPLIDGGEGEGKYTQSFNCAKSSSCIYKFNIGRGNEIQCLGGRDSSGQLLECGVVTKADAVFYRPNPDAKIILNDNITQARELSVCLISPQGDKGRVILSDTGQISVEGPDNCPQDDE
jgi:prepilin-type N-terminal cleavage/methylation domain-containing protein